MFTLLNQQKHPGLEENRSKKLVGNISEYSKKGAKRKTMPLKTFSRDGNKCFVIFLNLCCRERRNK